MASKPFTVLGIETSCDETAAAVVRGTAPGPGEILSNIVFSQTEAHAPYGGVVPEIASRAHLEILDGVIERALDDARHSLADVDAIVEWVKATGLRPFLDRLTPDERPDFLSEYREALEEAYPQRTDGRVLFRFPRLFVVITGN